MRGDLGREAHESLRSQRVERLPMGLLVRREAAGRGDFAQVGVVGVGRDRGARGEEQRVNAAFSVTQSPCQRGSWRMFVYDPLMDSWTVESELPWRQYFIMPPPCIHNGRLVVFTRDGAFERATDGSWSSSEYECDDLQGLSGIRFVCKSVLLG